ncbi:pirin family protein [Oceanihabitans sediminis]|uniref:pirin family protein n=1 Tax=Oceanihabitans sediminis TaxID=1812012 RepID=UPI0009305D7F|nr:pirin family protein [Oceanihabitans sediminis]MDX1278341.1 pirin family protein [Oceanihabitans sediminis]MDX1773346.1 pirin family protein [Oceanihabitans sediminis]
MSNVKLIIEERAADIGNFMVGRLLPFRQKRMVGPFIFIDHMGPAQLGPNENMDVDMHPHIGLSTLTFLFEGSVFHRDSLGTAIEIKPGAVNWMTAGKGVVHTERTPEYLRNQEKKLHGLQIWVALPKEDEQCEPSFTHINANDLPAWEEDEVKYKLIAGEVFGKKSPVPVYSPLYLIEIKTEKAKTINIGEHLFGESALYILEGEVKSDGNSFGPKQILVAKDSSLCAFEMEANTSVYIFGGEAFPEERFIEWNFVSSKKELIEKAKKDWNDDAFPKVPNETVRVPLPQPKSFKSK